MSIFSCALDAFSGSSVVIVTELLAARKAIWCVALFEKIETLFTAESKSAQLALISFSLSVGITL